MAEAARAVEDVKQRWAAYGNRRVTEQELVAADDQIQYWRRALADADARVGWLDRVEYRCLSPLAWVSKVFGLGPDHTWVLGLFVGLATVVVITPFVLVVRPGFGVFAAAAGIGFALASAAAAILLPYRAPAGIDSLLAELRERMSSRATEMREVGRGLADAREVTRRLQAVRDAENAYAEALSRQKRIQELLSSTRYLLQATDWRVLRGIPFEKFLADVFEFLGYRVETTKASGDQGIDLIVTGKGRRIAIQAKGYEGSVGNGSVQEAYTGAKFYDCPDCVVITNSRFTSGAAEVARRVECKLIDGDRIPDLIDGHIL